MRRFAYALCFLALSSLARANVVLPIAIVPSASPITGSLVASRASSCVAPCAVFFDATGTTDASVTSSPFHELQYTWNFGDNDTLLWANGAHVGDGTALAKKNRAEGPVTMHVYDPAAGSGTQNYTATLTITDGTNTRVLTQAIQVTDPTTVFAGALTICVSAAGTFTGCPGGAQQITSSNFVTAISTYCVAGNRILFNRGETWTPGAAATCASATSSSLSPISIGAYGSGALPKIQPNVNTGQVVLYFSSATTPAMADLRITDLEIDGSLLTPGTNTTGAIASFGGAKQVTLLRVNIHDVHGGGFSTPLLDVWNADANPARHGHVIFDQMAIVDSTFSHAVGGNGANLIYMEATRLGFMGNLVDDSLSAEHGIRSAYADKAVYGNNTISNVAAHKHLWKQHAGAFGGVGCLTCGLYSQNIVSWGNKFVGGVEDWSVAIGPEDALSDERVRKLIVEGNWFTAAGGAVQISLILWASDVTVRNNVFDMTGASFHDNIKIDQRGVEPASNVVNVYNNTFYSSSAGDFQGLLTGAAVTNITAKNNVGYAPSATSPVLIQNGCGGCLTTATNSSDFQVKNTTPNFTSVAPFTPANAKPTSGYPIAGGVSVPVWSDFFLVTQPSPRDIGAVIH